MNKTKRCSDCNALLYETTINGEAAYGCPLCFTITQTTTTHDLGGSVEHVKKSKFKFWKSIKPTPEDQDRSE